MSSNPKNSDTNKALHLDPEINVVVFEFREGDAVKKVVREGPTRADDCLQSVWHEMKTDLTVEPSAVTRIYSEWSLSSSDMQFVEATFPDAEFMYSFERPATKEGWEVAMKKATDAMKKAQQQR